MLKIPKQYKEKEVLYRRMMIFAAALVMIVLYFEKIANVLGYIITICMPFIFGGGLAFVFNIIANNLMKFGIRFLGLKENLITRTIINIISIILFFSVVAGFVIVIFPQIFSSFEKIASNLPNAIETLYLWAYRTTLSIPSLHEWILNLNINLTDLDNLSSWLSEITGWVISGGANNIFGSVYQFISTTFSFVLSVLVSLMFSIIVLFNKRTVVKECKGLLKAYLSADAYSNVIHVIRLVNKTFTQYIGGTCTECIILGTLVTCGATIFNLPYATLSGIIVGIGALIPMFGAIVAAMIAALFIATESVSSAAYFMIMFICIQQVEGNFIYPNVVGRSVGFPPMYVVVAVTIGASLAGVMGMVVFIPICSCIYQLVKEDVVLKLKLKKINNQT